MGDYIEYNLHVYLFDSDWTSDWTRKTQEGKDQKVKNIASQRRINSKYILIFLFCFSIFLYFHCVILLFPRMISWQTLSPFYRFAIWRDWTALFRSLSSCCPYHVRSWSRTWVCRGWRTVPFCSGVVCASPPTKGCRVSDSYALQVCVEARNRRWKYKKIYIIT